MTGLWKDKPHLAPSLLVAGEKVQGRAVAGGGEHAHRGLVPAGLGGSSAPSCHLLSLHMLFTASPKTTLLYPTVPAGNQEGSLFVLSFLFLELTLTFYRSAALFIFCYGELAFLPLIWRREAYVALLEMWREVYFSNFSTIAQ